MKRIPGSVIMTAALFAGCALLTTSESAAEPILGQDSLLAPPDTTTQRQEVADALALFKARDFEGTLKLLRAAVKNNADLPPAQVIMADLFSQTNSVEGVRNALDQAISDAPDDPEAYMLLAGIALRDRDVAKADLFLQKARSLMSTFDKSVKRKEWLQPRILSGMAGVAEARKDWAGAQKTLEEWLKLDPKSTAAMQRLAFCLLQQNNVDGALAKLRDVAKADPDVLPPEAALAQFYERSGDRENAGKWMAAALKAAPKDLKTRLMAGRWAMEEGQLDEAQKHAVAATKIDPKSLEARLFRGLIALFQKDYTAAELLFDAAVKQAPRNVIASNNLALALIEQGDESKSRRALEYAEANSQQYPKLPEIASTYGLVLYRLGRLDDAEKALAAAAPIASSDVDTAYALARVAVDRGRKAEARQLLETALKSTKPFMLRQEAEELLEELKK